ncbi:hypothetical protein TRFO_20500 [Tritrichomonas foetus]|uniref:Uncharacterized protein n=1 Tax=Tritrichomonas foetus TaxID=1144522 RepID=A0A1J4KLF9_9EUKA|nr:hypothetical protein TRFO_20500 [Tritrichomonas foetus]|eukprot:OHT10213.1 hypothetical protein TRFO_20500 [Tritrichomonas foetus]
MEINEEAVLKLAPYAQLVDQIANMTQKNMMTILPEILSSKFTNNLQELPHLINAIMYTIKIRPNQIATMAMFVKKLLEYNNEFYKLTELRPFLLRMIINILSLPNPFPEHTAVPYFLYQLMNKEVLTFREFAAAACLYTPDTIISIKSKKWLFCLFGPELEDCNEDFYHSLFKLFEFKDENPFLQRVFHAYMEELETLKENDWIILKNRRNYDLDPFSVASIIEHDQLSYLSHNAKGSFFDINQHIESSIIARSKYQQQRPTLLQYSALCGASRCFRFLLQHHAKIDFTDENGLTLGDYLAISCNQIINNYLFSLNITISQALHWAIQFHHNELYFKLFAQKIDKVSIKDKAFINTMQKAIISNNLKIFLHLYQTGSKINEGFKNGNTALHAAAFHGHITMCKALLMLTNDLNKKNFAGIYIIFLIEHLFIMLLQVAPISLSHFSLKMKILNLMLQI